MAKARFLKRRPVTAYCHEHGRQLSAEAFAVIEHEVEHLLYRACTNHFSGHHKRITATEAALACT